MHDLTERVIPVDILALPTPSERDAQRALVEHAGRAQGIATAAELRDYFRLSSSDTQAAIVDLVEEGTLIPVSVAGWRQPAYLHRDAARPRRALGDALLAPFDPLVWERGRTERLFGFHYRIDIYTPAAQRRYGYYVLPYLLDGQLVGRADVKADRAASTLVHCVHVEPDASGDTADRMSLALERMAGWLGLDRTRVRLG